MSPRNRVLVLVATFVAMAALFVVLRPTDSPDDESGSTPAAVTEPAAGTADAEPSATIATTATAAPAAAPEPAAPQDTEVTVTALKPVGGVKSLKAKKGDTVRFTVSADQAENVHLHGYDIEKDVAPDKPARFKLEADITGIFEIELENSGVPIAELTVEP